MPALSPLELTLTALAAACVGLAKAGFGGAGMLAVLLMAAAFPPTQSTGALLPLLIIGDTLAVASYHHHSQPYIIWKLLPPSILGIVPGWLLMSHLPANHFAKLIGLLIIGLLVLTILQRLIPSWSENISNNQLLVWSLGCLAGLATMLSNAAGPIATIYFLACRLPKMQFVGTAAWFFLLINLIKIPFSSQLGLITPHTLFLNFSLSPVVLAGFLLGKWLLHQVNQKSFELITICLSFLGALRLLSS